MTTHADYAEIVSPDACADRNFEIEAAKTLPSIMEDTQDYAGEIAEKSGLRTK